MCLVFFLMCFVRAVTCGKFFQMFERLLSNWRKVHISRVAKLFYRGRNETMFRSKIVSARGGKFYCEINNFIYE